jgi:hypothetical protein
MRLRLRWLGEVIERCREVSKLCMRGGLTLGQIRSVAPSKYRRQTGRSGIAVTSIVVDLKGRGAPTLGCHTATDEVLVERAPKLLRPRLDSAIHARICHVLSH